VSDGFQKLPEPSGGSGLTGEAARARAMELLAEGYTVTAVARQLGLSRPTVRGWRDSPDGQKQLAAARAARDAESREVVADARRIVRANLAFAAQVLADKLRSPHPHVALAAARELLDRGGLPRTERVEGGGAPAADLSRLTDDELVTLARLQQKATSGGEGA
jgi:transposase-like protein